MISENTEPKYARYINPARRPSLEGRKRGFLSQEAGVPNMRRVIVCLSLSNKLTDVCRLLPEELDKESDIAFCGPVGNSERLAGKTHIYPWRLQQMRQRRLASLKGPT